MILVIDIIMTRLRETPNEKWENMKHKNMLSKNELTKNTMISIW